MTLNEHSHKPVNDPLDRIARALERIADMLEQRVETMSGGTGNGPPGGGG